MTWITLTVTILTVIVSPLLGWIIKYIAEKRAAKDDSDRLLAQQETIAEKAAWSQSARAGSVNQSIDNQKATKEQWLKDQPRNQTDE